MKTAGHQWKLDNEKVHRLETEDSVEESVWEHQIPDTRLKVVFSGIKLLAVTGRTESLVLCLTNSLQTPQRMALPNVHSPFSLPNTMDCLYSSKVTPRYVRGRKVLERARNCFVFHTDVPYALSRLSIIYSLSYSLLTLNFD